MGLELYRRLVAQTGGFADLAFELFVARPQRLVHLAAAEPDQEKEQNAKIEELEREGLAAEAGVFTMSRGVRVVAFRVPFAMLRTFFACFGRRVFVRFVPRPRRLGCLGRLMDNANPRQRIKRGRAAVDTRIMCFVGWGLLGLRS